MGRRWSTVIVAVAVGLAGCGWTSGEGPVAATDPSPRDVPLQVAVEQPRYLATRHMLEVILRNTGASPVTLEQVQLGAPRFASVPPTPRDTVVAPGARRDVPLPYGEARCEGSPQGEEVVVAWVRDADGQTVEVRLPLPDPDPVLDRLHDTECRQRAVTEAVDIGFGPSWTRSSSPGNPAIQGSLVLQRRASDEPVTLTGLGGGVIFGLGSLAGAARPVARLDPGSARVEIPVEIGVTRCDPHALTESKKTFRFPVWVVLGDQPEQYLEIEPQGEGRRLLEELLATCMPQG